MRLPFALFGWSLFSLEFSFNEIDIERGFENPSQQQKFPDSVRICQAFRKCFNLPAIDTFGSCFYKNNFFTSTCAYSYSSLGSRDGIPLKKVALFWDIFILVLIISFLGVVVALALLLETTLLLVWGIIPSAEVVLILRGGGRGMGGRGAFWKGLVYTRRIFEHSTSKQLFGVSVCFNSSGVTGSKSGLVRFQYFGHINWLKLRNTSICRRWYLQLMAFIWITIISLYIRYLHNYYNIYLQGDREIQKQPPEVFCENRYFKKFWKFHRKKPVLESQDMIKAFRIR